VPPSCNV